MLLRDFQIEDRALQAFALHSKFIFKAFHHIKIAERLVAPAHGAKYCTGKSLDSILVAVDALELHLSFGLFQMPFDIAIRRYLVLKPETVGQKQQTI